jgi:hypothetical protein
MLFCATFANDMVKQLNPNDRFGLMLEWLARSNLLKQSDNQTIKQSIGSELFLFQFFFVSLQDGGCVPPMFN